MMKKQSGLTMISWAIVLGFLAIQGVMALRIIPVYMNYSSVKSIMNSLGQGVETKGKTAKELSEMFRKRLKINNLYTLAANKEAFKFKKSQTGYTLTASYEERGPIFGNLEFVATFEHQVELTTQ